MILALKTYNSYINKFLNNVDNYSWRHKEMFALFILFGDGHKWFSTSNRLEKGIINS